MQDNDALVTPFFKNVPYHDEQASKREGRPIYRDMEVVEVRIAGDRNFAPTFPATGPAGFWRRINGEDVTYAERWPKQYARFKENQEQIAEGTPLSELPFLTEAKRMELRGLKVYTAEALASLDGKNLAALGQGGRVMKNQAAAYLEKSEGTAHSVALAAEVENLRAQVAALSAMAAAPAMLPAEPEPDDPKAALREQLRELTGTLPRGNPSVETLQRMVDEALASA